MSKGLRQRAGVADHSVFAFTVSISSRLERTRFLGLAFIVNSFERMIGGSLAKMIIRFDAVSCKEKALRQIASVLTIAVRRTEKSKVVDACRARVI
jgi:hypothetical protein